MDPIQPAGPNPVADRGLAESGVEKLRGRDLLVLTGGDPRDHGFARRPLTGRVVTGR
jgi:hypothetical protein